MRIHLGGHLNWYDPGKRSWLDVPQPEPVSPRTLAERLGLPLAEIAVVTVNRTLIHLEEEVLVADGDVVEFFSPMGGG